jgi:hypothetical protein
MFLREPPTLTLPDVRERLDVGGEVISARSSEITVNLTADVPSIRVKDREVPATKDGIAALAARLDIPAKFLERTPDDLTETILQRMLQTTNAADVHAVKLSDSGLLDIRSQQSRHIDPRRLVDVAARVIDPEAPVIDFWNEPSREFRLDVLVPADFDRGWGGDRQVNDLTGAGLRFTQNLKQGTQFYAPSASLLLYRLACTNGYERMSEGERIDARGQTVDEILTEFEGIADRMFARAEAEIEAFYAMRQERVEHPEQALLRMGQEQGLSDRILMGLVRRVPEITGDDGTTTMFDLTNLITNEANNPAVRRSGARRILEQTGGSLIHEHATRCAHCQSRLN